MCSVQRNRSGGSGNGRGSFLVVVHDVCPVHSRNTQQIVAALEPLVGQAISAAVVPNWHGVPFDAEICFAEWVTRQFGEILLHGWTHQREAGRGVISCLTNRSDEFAGLTSNDTNARIQLGQDRLSSLFGHQVAGFVAPAWQRGRIDRKTLRLHGLEFLLGYTAIECADSRRIPVSTITWDVGRFGRLGPAAEMIGRVLGRVRGRSIRCLAAHPADVSRGYLPRILSTVESWIESGGTPILPGELVCAANEECAS